jgi:ferredoxin
MSYKISDDCISCGACESECPNQAISEGETIYKIDPAKCSECVGANPSSKCAEVCPVDACIPDPALKETKEQLLAKWQKIHPGEKPKA